MLTHCTSSQIIIDCKRQNRIQFCQSLTYITSYDSAQCNFIFLHRETKDTFLHQFLWHLYFGLVIHRAHFQK